MSGNRLVFDGLDAFKAQLRRLPNELRQEAADTIARAVEGAATDLRAAYPTESHTAHGTGKLSTGVSAKVEITPYGVTGVLKSAARHAHLYEFGTQMRRTASGANRGAAPAHPTFIPIVVRRRRVMYDQLAGLLRRAGFEVSGV